MSAKKTAFYGMFLALALVAGYIEQLIPINLGIPGVKLGLANIVTMLLLYIVGVPAACLISVLRILLSGFLFGSGFAMVYSAMIVLETKALAYYLPILILSGLVAGILIGILSGILTKRLNPIIKQHFV